MKNTILTQCSEEYSSIADNSAAPMSVLIGEFLDLKKPDIENLTNTDLTDLMQNAHFKP